MLSSSFIPIKPYHCQISAGRTPTESTRKLAANLNPSKAEMPEMLLLPGAIAEMFAQVSHTGMITVADRYGLMAAIVSGGLTEEERRSIDRMLHAVAKGRLKIVSELSWVR